MQSFIHSSFLQVLLNSLLIGLLKDCLTVKEHTHTHIETSAFIEKECKNTRGYKTSRPKGPTKERASN